MRGAHETHVAFLDQVKDVLHPAALKAHGYFNHQAQVRGYQPESRVAVALLDPVGQIVLFFGREHGESTDFTQIQGKTVTGPARCSAGRHQSGSFHNINRLNVIILGKIQLSVSKEQIVVILGIQYFYIVRLAIIVFRQIGFSGLVIGIFRRGFIIPLGLFGGKGSLGGGGGFGKALIGHTLVHMISCVK